jgi:hypothetical protein
MESTIEGTIEVYLKGLRKSGTGNVTVNAADMLACLEHLALGKPTPPAQEETDE